MTPFEAAQLSEDALTEKIRAIVAPKWCDCAHVALFSDYDVAFWVCIACGKSPDEAEFVLNHGEFEYEDYVMFMLDEMRPTLTPFDEGWMVAKATGAPVSSTVYRIEFGLKDMLTSGSGKSIIRAIAEAYLLYKEKEENAKGTENTA